MNTDLTHDPLPTRKHTALVVVMGMAAAAVIVGLVYAIVLSAANSEAINERQKDAITTIDNTAQILAKIEDCTTPKMECYERSQSQTAAAVADVNEVVVLAAACASGAETRDELYIQRCVLAALADRKGHP